MNSAPSINFFWLIDNELHLFLVKGLYLSTFCAHCCYMYVNIVVLVCSFQIVVSTNRVCMVVFRLFGVLCWAVWFFIRRMLGVVGTY